MRKIALILVVLSAFAVLPARASAAAAVRGTVTDGNGRGLAYMCVWFTNGARVDGFPTNLDGTYEVFLDAGVYTVKFQDCNEVRYATQWWPNANSPTGAQELELHDGGLVTGIDAALSPGGSITGIVTARGGAPLNGECVDATGPNGEAHAVTDARGGYGLIVPAGSYVVRFRDCAGYGYVTQWYDRKPNAGAAELVQVSAGRVTTPVDAVMNDDKPDVRLVSLSATPDSPAGVGTYSVDVVVSNETSVPAEATLLVEACPVTIGACRPIANQDEPIDGGARVEHRFAWDATAWAGKARLTAKLILEFDADVSNNERVIDVCVAPGNVCPIDAGVRAP